MRPRIRWRLVVPFLILLVAVVIIITTASLNTFRQHEAGVREGHYFDLVHLIAIQAGAYYGVAGETADLNRIADHYAETLGVSIIFISRDGDVLGSSTAINQLPVPVDTLTEVISAGKISRSSDQGLIVSAAVAGDDEIPLGYVGLLVPLAATQFEPNRIWNLAVAVTLAASALVVIFSAIIYDFSRKPVESLTTAAQQISSGNFHNLDFPNMPQELSELSQSLSHMAKHLGDQIDALTSERAKLSAVLNQMTDGVLIADYEGRVQLLNPAAERLFQIDAKEGLGRSVVEVLRYHQLVDLWRTARDGQRQITVLEIGPQHLFLQVTGIPLQSAEKGSTLILFQDLTQLRRLETVRRDFISNVSHELRTPLASLKALGETLQESALDDPPAARRFIIRMETEIDNLTQLVNELLELSRIESGKVPLSFHRIKPCDLLRPAYERMELQAERAGLTLIMDCPPDLPIVFADPDRITQVVINLVHNATKFTPSGGQITLSAYRDGDFVVLFVKDTGIGIPQRDMGRIFERFYKADRARTSGGTGLGLSIARHMVESHGGFIWAESEEDLGSTFYFSLPIA